jgi:hypothetical protein
MPGSALRAAVRCAHASTTVRARASLRPLNDPVCSGVKVTTSHRPKAGPVVPQPGLAGTGPRAGPREGKRFSNTTTS